MLLHFILFLILSILIKTPKYKIILTLSSIDITLVSIFDISNIDVHNVRPNSIPGICNTDVHDVRVPISACIPRIIHIPNLNLGLIYAIFY